MARAYDLYQTQQPDSPPPSGSSLYSNIPSPFKKQDSGLQQALSELNRKLPTSSPQNKLRDPIDVTFSELKANENLPTIAQDNTRVEAPIMPKFLESVSQPVSPFKKGFDFNKFQKDTVRTESGGDKNATNAHSSAQGKYQFLWGDWGDSIKSVTGVKTPEEFRSNSKAQDQFFKYYTDKVVLPEVNKLRPLADKYGLSDNELARLVHFRGSTGAKKALEQNLLDTKLEKHNMTINQYLGRK